MKCELCTFIFNAGFCKLFGVCYIREFLQHNDVNEIKRKLIGSAEKQIDELAATKGKKCEACKLIFTAEFCKKFGVCYNPELFQQGDVKEVKRMLSGSEEKKINELSVDPLECPLCEMSVNIIGQMIKTNMTKV